MTARDDFPTTRIDTKLHSNKLFHRHRDRFRELLPKRSMLGVGKLQRQCVLTRAQVQNTLLLPLAKVQVGLVERNLLSLLNERGTINY